MKLTEPASKEEWLAYYDCRFRTLREPWGHLKGSEKAEDDEDSFHLMAIEQGTVCGVARIHFVEPHVLQLRFMGVDEKYRGKGVGKTLLDAMEELARSKGGREMILHARESAVPFYKRCGYHVLEKSHLLWGEIQHYKMGKRLL